MRDIEIELGGRSFRILGGASLIRDAIAAALRGNGGVETVDGLSDLLIVACPTLPRTGAQPTLLTEAATLARAMHGGRGGRVVVVLSAMAAVPARRHPDYSVEMAAGWARTRTLAMELAPQMLVNAVGAGVIEDGATLLAGDREMAGHAAVPRGGRIEDIVNAVLFLADPANTYTTGQLLNVDGGWSVGYGRNF